ncbi:MAG: thiamine pyrophosphate-dependent dehydrogenase E1 component subunit alpha [Pseudomonadota bacterium]
MQLSRDELKDAWRRMMRIRVFEDRVADEFAAGNIPGFVHLYAGQEACGVGMCMNLSDEDWIGSTHRGHGHCIAKTVEIEGMMHEIMARRSGVCGGKGGSMHIADMDKGMLGANGIVGGNPPLAVGAALTAKTKKTGNVAVSFAGDGASNQGTTFEAMNLAVVLKLPVIFVVENNGYGEGTGADYAIGTDDVAKRAEGFGMPAVSVDGTDFFKTYEAAREAVERARTGNGPSFIEMVAMRYRGHFEGDAQVYRAADEVDNLKRSKDPLAIFRKRVTEAALLEDADLDAIRAEVEQEIESAVTSALAADTPTEADLETDVYVRYG